LSGRTATVQIVPDEALCDKSRQRAWPDRTTGISTDEHAAAEGNHEVVPRG